MIEENYFRDPNPRKLGDDSVNGMVNELRKRYDDRFSHYFNPEALRQFEAQTSGQFTGRRARRGRDQGGPAGRPGLRGHPGRGGRDQDRRRDHRGRRRPTLKGLNAEAAAAKIKGPPGTR